MNLLMGFIRAILKLLTGTVDCPGIVKCMADAFPVEEQVSIEALRYGVLTHFERVLTIAVLTGCCRFKITLTVLERHRPIVPVIWI